MKNKNKITVIMTYFKKIKYFSHTIQSLKKQTKKNFNIIVVYDDQDLSDLPNIKKILRNKKNVKIIVNKKNIGPGLSRNIGIKNAKSKYIAFLDCDDIWSPKKIQKQYAYMEKNNLDLSYTAYSTINSNGKVIKKNFFQNKTNYNDLIKSCDIGLSTVMVKKEFLGNNLFPSLKTKEDYVLWLKLSKKIKHFKGLPQRLVFWRKLNNSQSSNILQKLIDGFRVYFLYEKKNFFISIFFLLRLSINFILKNYFISRY